MGNNTRKKTFFWSLLKIPLPPALAVTWATVFTLTKKGTELKRIKINLGSNINVSYG